MSLDFNTVYKLRLGSDPAHPEIVMAPVPLPAGKGWWVRRTSPDHPERILRGDTFEGEGGKVVVVTKDGPATFEPLTLDLWKGMNPSDSSHLPFDSDGDLQEFYWHDWMTASEETGVGDIDSISKALAIQYGAEIQEGRKAKPGEVHQWSDGSYLKLRDGTWQKIPGTEPAAEGAEIMAETITRLNGMVGSGELAPGMDIQDHIDQARGVVDAHRKGVVAFGAKLEEMAGGGANVQGRVKTLGSVLGKIATKPHWFKKADDVQDGTGYRIIHDSLDDVTRSVGKIKKQFKVKAERDYISNPQGSYRSHHLIVEDEDGLEKEIQVRTRRQHEMAEWSHDVFKPRTSEQKKKVDANRKEIEKTQAKIAEWAYEKDKGKDPGPQPECPEQVSNAVGCRSLG